MTDINKTLDMQEAIDLIGQIDELIHDLDGRAVNAEDNNKEKAAVRAQTSRNLTHVAHLADKLRLSILDQYYVYKGVQQ